jgi:hypothetical protein
MTILVTSVKTGTFEALVALYSSMATRVNLLPRANPSLLCQESSHIVLQALPFASMETNCVKLMRDIYVKTVRAVNV